MSGDLVKLYSRLPVAAQNVACSLYGWKERRLRFGPAFRHRFTSLKETDRASRSEIEAYQDAQIERLVRHAFDTVPYYRRVMEERGLTPSGITSRDDLVKLPVLTKEVVRANHRDLLSDAHRGRRLRARRTSGSTGTALQVPAPKEAVAFQWAVWWRHRWRFGVQPLTWHVNFSGRPVVPSAQKRPPYWRWNMPMRQLLVGMQQVKRANIASLAVRIDDPRFGFWSGVPSIIHPFVEFLEAEGVVLNHPPRVVFTGAEPTEHFQRAAIKRVTGAIVTDQYGFAEGCGNASRCEHGHYHEDWEFGVLEAVGSEGLGNGDVRGKVVATGFANPAFPLIRYEVGDAAVWKPTEFRCSCGRASRVIERIDGRLEDYVVTPEGTRVRRFSYLFKKSHTIREAQVVQERQGRITIRYVPRTRVASDDLEAIRRKVSEWISPTLAVEFEEVGEIPRGAGGKFKAVLSRLDLDTTQQDQEAASGPCTALRGSSPTDRRR